MRKKLAIIGIVAASALVAGTAFAYWTSQGDGVGSATAGTDTEWAVDSSPASGDLLTPGGPTDTIAFTVTNNSSGHQQLDEVEISVANADGSPWDGFGDCSAADFSVGGDAAGLSHTITANDDLGPGGVYSDDVTLQMVNRTDTVPGDGDGNQDDCRTVTVPLFIAAS